MRASALPAVFVVLCGAFAGWLVGRLVPAELTNGDLKMETKDYRLERKDAQPFEITDSKWLLVPWLFPDFDLHMDVELGENMDLDLLMRQVEPRVVEQKDPNPEVERIVKSQLTPFQGRFTALRLSTRGDGQPWLLRDDALFGASRGGAELAPGLTATVWVQGRGRMLRANVAGKWLPWFAATDVFGGFALVAHGGKAVLRNLIIECKGLDSAWLLLRWTWIGLGALGGLLAVVAARLRRTPVFQVVLTAACMIAPVWAVTRTQFALDPWIVPELEGLLVLLGGSAALTACAVGVRRKWDVLWLALVAAVVGALWLLCRADYRTDNMAIDAVFGPKSGATASEALAQRVRGPFEVHDVGPVQHRVFLLGGQLLYERGAPDQHLEPMLKGDLRVALQQRIDVPCLPTVDGHTQQQWRMFTQFFTGYRPNVLVFGVPRDEAAIDPATGKPRSFPSTVASTLQKAREYCGTNGCKLVLFVDAGLPAELFEVLRAAESDGVPLVVAGANEDSPLLSKKLAAVIAPLLR